MTPRGRLAQGGQGMLVVPPRQGEAARSLFCPQDPRTRGSRALLFVGVPGHQESAIVSQGGEKIRKAKQRGLTHHRAPPEVSRRLLGWHRINHGEAQISTQRDRRQFAAAVETDPESWLYKQSFRGSSRHTSLKGCHLGEPPF